MDGSVYAHGQPKSNEQQRFIAQRVAEQRKQRRASAADTHSISHSPSMLSTTTLNDRYKAASNTAKSSKTTITIHETDGEYDHSSSSGYAGSDTIYRTTTAASIMSSRSEITPDKGPNQPFEMRHGRRYLRDIPYPLPCDLPELHRQNLRTLLAYTVFGRAVCAPSVSQDIPQKVLELGCGTGYWSALCHEYFCSLGYDDVSFTGLDVAALAPDLAQQGVNWTFVQHDLRRLPLPFQSGEFDPIMLKDLSLILPYETLASPSQRMTEECIRLLKPGGTLEVWEADYCIRSLVSSFNPRKDRRSTKTEDLERLGTFPITDATHFAPAENKYLTQANDWIHRALSDRRLSSAPCARIAQLLLQEPDHLIDVGSERIAIPFSTERFGPEMHCDPKRNDSPMSKGKARFPSRSLTTEQKSLRQTALVTVLQLINNLEPVLREVNGKSPAEWSNWWSAMLSNLSEDNKGALKGECLEIGAWWATKIDPS